ncbi:MAG: tetratricopeptide repeat protein [Chitinivibrionales bacterium]
MRIFRFGKRLYLFFVALGMLVVSAFSDDNLDHLMQLKRYSEAISYADTKLPPVSRPADAWVKVGFANEELGFPEKALACYLVGSQSDAKNYDACVGVARIYNKMGNPQNATAAMAFAKKASEIRSTSESNWEFAKACITLKKTSLAKEALEHVVKSGSSNPPAFRALSEIYWKEQSYDKAVPLLKAAYDADQSAENAFKIGKALRETNKPDSALKFLKESLVKNPTMYAANLELARAYYDKNKYLAAANEYEKIVPKTKLPAMDQYFCAVSNEKTGSPEAALKAYYAAAAGFGHSTSTEAILSHLKAGNSDLERKNFKTALAHFRFISIADSSGAKVPDIQILLAEAYSGCGDNQKAIAGLEKVLSVDKNNVEANLRLAELYQKTGLPDKARVIFEKCLNLSPSDPRIFLSLGDYNLKMNNYIDAQTNYEKSYLLNKSVRAAAGSAQAAFALSQCDKAAQAAQSALSLDASLIDLHVIIYKCSMKNKAFKEAREHLDTLVVKIPSDVGYWKSLAECCVQLKDTVQCAYADKNILRLDKNNIESLQRLADYQLSRKENKKAFGTYKKLIALSPQNAEALKNLSALTLEEKDKLTALAYLKKYCELRPGDVLAQKSLGDLYYGMKNYDAALIPYREAVKLDPTIKGVYKPYVRLLMAKVMKTELENVLASAIKTGEADAELCSQLGAFFEIQMQFAKAMEYYDKARQLDPGSSKVAARLARCQVKMGKVQDAIASYQQVIALDPGAKEEYKIIGDLYRNQNMPEQAVDAYKKYFGKNGNGVDLALFIGEFAFENKNYDEAVRYLKGIQKQKALDLSFLVLLGKAYYRTKNYAKAVEVFERLRGIRNKNQKNGFGAEMLHMLADSYDKLSNKPNAVAVYAAYAKLPEVKDPDAAFRMAQLEETIIPILAAKMYEENATKYPDEYRNYYEAARLYSKERTSHEKAAYMIRKCIAMKDTVPFLWLVLGRIYGTMNNTQQELEAYQNYIQKGQPKPEACEEIGVSLLDRAMINEAMVYLEMASTLKPDNPNFLYQLARGYEKTNRLSDALSIIQKAAHLKPENVEIQSLQSYITMRMEQRQGTDSVDRR